MADKKVAAQEAVGTRQQAGSQPAAADRQIDPQALVNALNAAEGQIRELTDLVTRLNRSLRQLEEQNQQLGQRLQALQTPEP